MANALKHKTQSAEVDLGVAGEIGPDEWNEEHLFAGGAVDGDVLVWSAAASDKVGWLSALGTLAVPSGGLIGGGSFSNLRFSSADDVTGRLNFNPILNFVNTSGASVDVGLAGSFVPASGSGSWAMFHLNPVVNGTSTGTAYGLGIASKTNTLTGGSIKLFSVGTTTTNLFTGYTPLIEIDITGYIEGKEQTAPAAPAANGYRLFAQDNGAGKTQLMVIFGSGVAQQIAIEP